MSHDDKPDLRSQLGLRKFRDRLPGVAWRRWSGALDWLKERFGLTFLPRWLFVILAGTWALLAATLLVGLLAVILQLIFQRPPEGREAVWNWRFSIAQLAALTTVLGAVIALPITINRLALTRRQTQTTEQGHITDRINTAVQGLGAEKTVKREGEEYTQPNLEVRIGAIYALERIAQDSDRDHVQIMEILCAYIRQNAPAPAEDDWPELEMKEGEEDGPLEADWDERLETFREEQDETKKTLKLREDIQTALTVIGRRDPEQRKIEAGPGKGEKALFPFDVPCPDHDVPDEDHNPAALDAYRGDLNAWRGKLEAYEGYRLDLRGADLRGAELAEHDLQGAKLDGTYLQGAHLIGAQLQGAELRQAQLQGADLWEARMQGARLMAARLQGANLQHARLHGAILVRARLQGTNLGHARLQGATLSQTSLHRANLEEARLHWSGLRGARLQGARLVAARLQWADLSQASLHGADLWQAWLQGTRLERARLEGADLNQARFDIKTDLSEANMQGATVACTDFTDVPQIAEHLVGIFGDASVKLPGGHGPEHENWPPHWPRYEMNDLEFLAHRKAWQADPGNYTPPERDEPA